MGEQGGWMVRCQDCGRWTAFPSVIRDRCPSCQREAAPGMRYRPNEPADVIRRNEQERVNDDN